LVSNITGIGGGIERHQGDGVISGQLLPDSRKKPTGFGWLFLLQINDLPEFDVERAMGIEHVDLTINPLAVGLNRPGTSRRSEALNLGRRRSHEQQALPGRIQDRSGQASH
jgi:hypothetical protein